MSSRVVSPEEALAARCPKCGAHRGSLCTYLADAYLPGPYPGWGTRGPEHITHAKGTDMIARVHAERREVIRRQREVIRRQREVIRRQRLGQSSAVPASRNAREASAALRAWDLAEYEQLRDWLRDWSWLFTEASLEHRPDGTLRGESCALGGPW